MLRSYFYYHDWNALYLGQMHAFCLSVCLSDSAYIVLAGESADDLVVDREEYFPHRSEWLPAECCEKHQNDYINTRISGYQWTTTEPCCLAHQVFNKPTPGLFKVEWYSDGFVGLCSKTYYCFGLNDTFTTKWLSKYQNVVNKESFLTVLADRRIVGGSIVVSVCTILPCWRTFRREHHSPTSTKAQTTRLQCQYGTTGCIETKKLKQQLFSNRYGSTMEESFHLYICLT